MPQYQGVWTLQQQAQAQSNQQWVTDPNFKNTTLLLQADGTGSGSQNQTFLDSSTNNFFITRNGNTTQGSFSPFSQAPGYWGNYFDGSGDYLTLGGVAGLAVGTSDFEISLWAYWNSVGTQVLYEGRPGSNGAYPVILTNSNVLIYFVNSANAITGPTVVANQWYYITVSRVSGTTRMFVNGSQVGSSWTDSTNYGTGGTAPWIGAGYAPGDYMNGYISNVRVVIGSGVTSQTVPTTPLTAITNTRLLTCQSNRFVDNSTNAYAITANGNVSVQAFGPFAPALQWTPDVVGGSGYFDGSGDYLNATGNSSTQMGTGAFTWECWCYITSVPSYQGLIDLRTAPSSGSSTGMALLLNTGTYTPIAATTSTILASSINIQPSAWNHVALTRTSGGTLTIWVNGVSGGTVGNSTNLTDTPIWVGGNNTSPYPAYVNGYLSNTRITKGSDLYTATFTPPTAPFTTTVSGGTVGLLLNYTNAGIYDGKMNTSWETVNSTQIATAPVKYGSGSIYFNGVASQRLLPSQLYPQLTPGTGDFTIECWLYVVGKGATAASAIIDYRPGVNGTYINWVVDFGGYSVGSASAPKLALYADSAVFMSGNSVLTMGQWNHVVLCRANGYTRMFINGVIDSGPTADTKNYGSGGSAGAYRPCIGATDGGDSLYGYIDDFRISRFARYIANFTPPQQALPRQ